MIDDCIKLTIESFFCSVDEHVNRVAALYTKQNDKLAIEEQKGVIKSQKEKVQEMMKMRAKGFDAYNADPDRYTGKGMLSAGRVTSIIGIVFSAIHIVYWIVWVIILGALCAGMCGSAIGNISIQ